MATIRARLAAVRAAWRAGAPTPAPVRPTRGGRPRPATVASRVLHPRRPSATRLELAPSASLELRPDPWQRLLGLGSILSVIVLAVGLFITNAANRAQQEANREQQRLTAQGQITDRFTASIEQLGQPGAEKVDVRLGAIHALRRIMRDSAADRSAVVEILSAFVRVHSVGGAARIPARSDKAAGATSVEGTLALPPVDIQAALAALGDSDSIGGRPDLTRVDLSRTDLRGMDLAGMDLSLANLEGTNLSDADLTDADLTGANLTNVELIGTELRGANLSGADLQHAQVDRVELDHATLVGASLVDASLRFAVLTDVDLSSTDLTDADLAGADLTNADLFGAEMLGVDLSGANLEGVASEALRCAFVDALTQLPAGVIRPAADAHRNDPECRARRAERAVVR